MKTKIFAAVAFLATLAAASSEITEAKNAARAETDAVNSAFAPEVAGALEEFFHTLESIPYDVLAAGDEATDAWLVAHDLREPGLNLHAERDEIPDAALEARDTGVMLAARASIWKIAKCVAAIIQLLATTAVPAAKLLRIRKYIDGLGGTREAVKLLLGATSKAEKLKAGGEILVNLAAELSGISSVKNNCF